MNSVLAFLSQYSKEFVSLIIPFLTFGLARYFQNRPRLVQSLRHAFTFLLQEPLFDKDGKQISSTQTVHTASVSILNAGRSAASKVEVVFNWVPQYFNVWPPRTYDQKLASDGRFSIIVENLAAKEVLGFELMAINRSLPEIVNVRSENSIAVRAMLHLQPVQPRWKIGLVVFWAFIGLATNVYLLTLLIQLIARPGAWDR